MNILFNICACIVYQTVSFDENIKLFYNQTEMHFKFFLHFHLTN